MTEITAEAMGHVAAQRRIELAQHITAFGVYDLDVDGVIRSWNPGAAAMTGFSAAAAIGQPYPWLFPRSDAGRRAAQQALEFCRGNQRLREEQQRRRADGGEFLAQVSMELARDDDGRILAFVEVIEDVTEAKAREAALYQQATRDALTGVANRGHFHEVAGKEIERARRFSEPLSVALMDIDHFKRVNDTHGHEAGDEALKAFAGAIENDIRRIDLLGRIGGEEFALLLPRASAGAAYELLQRLRLAVADLRVPLPDGGSFGYTVSMGVAQLASDAPRLTDLLRRADAALYRAKQEGRNQVQLWRDYSSVLRMAGR